MSVPAHIRQSDAYRFTRDVFILLGLGMLAWPIASFVAIFILDEPTRGAVDEARRYGMVGAVWGYPAFWGLGWVLFRVVANEGRTGIALAWPLVLPLAPVLFFAAAFMFGG